MLAGTRAAAIGLALLLAGTSHSTALAAPAGFVCPALPGQPVPEATGGGGGPGRQSIECRYQEVTAVVEWVEGFAPADHDRFCSGDWLRTRAHTDLAEWSPGRAAAGYVDTYYAVRPPRWPRAEMVRVRTAMLRWAEQRAGWCGEGPGLIYSRARHDAAASRLLPDPAGPVHVLRADLARVRLEPAVTGPSGDTARPWAKHPVGALAAAFNQGRPPDAERVLAAINGGFFGPIEGATAVSYSRVFTAAGAQPWQTAADAATEAREPAREPRILARMELRISLGPARLVAIEPGNTNDRSRPPGALVLGGGGRLLPTVSSGRRLGAAAAPDPDHRSARPRTALGFASTRPSIVFLMTVDDPSGVDIETLARLMRQAGDPGTPLDQGMAFDGGGSTQMWIDGRGVVSANENTRARVPGRPIVSALLVVGRPRP
jgi:hypothetical protein